MLKDVNISIYWQVEMLSRETFFFSAIHWVIQIEINMDKKKKKKGSVGSIDLSRYITEYN